MSVNPVHLLADIGGTYARFCLLGPRGELGEPVVLATGEYAGIDTALAAFRQRGGAPARFAGAAVCVAAPVTDDEIHLTNSTWTISRRALRDATGVPEPVLVNDFTAVALSVTELAEEELRFLGGGAPKRNAPMGVIGPGTGLGVSGLVPDGHGGYTALASEGGHASLAPCTERELETLSHLMARYEHVSAERVLSGPGLEALHATLAAMAGDASPEPTGASEIAERARGRASPVAVEAVAMFTRWLGAVAGDLALTLGAHGGVYIAGGIVPAWGELFDAALFRQGFEDKGRYRRYLQDIPAWLITHPNPAFKGLAALLRDR